MGYQVQASGLAGCIAIGIFAKTFTITIIWIKQNFDLGTELLAKLQEYFIMIIYQIGKNVR